jgi:hypothetical protein
MNFDLSIIILNYNTRDLIKKCLDSIIKEAKDPKNKELKVEVVVVDNNSSDDSVEILKKFKSTNYQSPVTIHLIENKENFGFSKAVNQGIKTTKNSDILLLNSDTQLCEGCLSSLFEFSNNKRPAIVGLKMLNPDLTPQASVFRLPTVLGAIKEYWFNQIGEFSKYLPKTENPIQVEAVSGGAMYISCEVLVEIGLINEKYFFYFEDLDYCRKAKAKGIKVYYLPKAKIIHEHGASGKNIANPKDQWKRLIPSSKIYHGKFKYYLINFIILIKNKLLSK